MGYVMEYTVSFSSSCFLFSISTRLMLKLCRELGLSFDVYQGVRSHHADDFCSSHLAHSRRVFQSGQIACSYTGHAHSLKNKK